MHLLPRVFLIGLCGLVLAAPGQGAERADDQILPRSVELERQGEAKLAAGKFEEAENLLETALAIDPRNRFAYVDIARVAERQHLYGKAVRMTNKALELDPNDVDAIAVQGGAMVEIGALARAQANVARLQKLCSSGCPQLAQLQAAISRGPTVASAKPPESPKSN